MPILKPGIPLVPPYVIGTGKDFNTFMLIAEEARSVQSGDILTGPSAQRFIVDSMDQVEDLFESYTVIYARLIVQDANADVDVNAIRKYPFLQDMASMRENLQSIL